MSGSLAGLRAMQSSLSGVQHYQAFTSHGPARARPQPHRKCQVIKVGGGLVGVRGRLVAVAVLALVLR